MRPCRSSPTRSARIERSQDVALQPVFTSINATLAVTAFIVFPLRGCPGPVPSWPDLITDKAADEFWYG